MNMFVPLNELMISEKNLRVVSASKEADRELVASIASQGVLQNLVVIPSAKGKKEVVAGGRRLASLHYLASKGEIEHNCPVPCLEKSEHADLTEISLAENIHAAMHPADQFVAYSRLVEELAKQRLQREAGKSTYNQSLDNHREILITKHPLAYQQDQSLLSVSYSLQFSGWLPLILSLMDEYSARLRLP